MSFLDTEHRVVRSSAEILEELGLDLLATWDPIRVPDAVSSWMSRPGILRRVASALSATIAADVDRIVAVGPGALVLGSAVSLATGLPYYAEDRGILFGSLHDGETVVVVSATDDQAHWSSDAAVDIAARIVVFSRLASNDRMVELSSVFVLGADGRMHVSERKAS